MSKAKPIIKCGGIGKTMPREPQPRKPTAKKVSVPELAKMEQLRKIEKLLNKVSSDLQRILKTHGGMIKDLNDMRRGVFEKNLAKGLKNKNIKKQFDRKKFKLLEKCGIKKTSLTDEDVERIKTRVDLV